jgi:hypothetical protein
LLAVLLAVANLALFECLIGYFIARDNFACKAKLLHTIFTFTVNCPFIGTFYGVLRLSILFNRAIFVITAKCRLLLPKN